MTITNKYVTAVIGWFLRNKTRKLAYGYEQELLDDEVLDQSYMRQFIANLREDVEDYIKQLEEEQGL